MKIQFVPKPAASRNERPHNRVAQGEPALGLPMRRLRLRAEGHVPRGLAPVHRVDVWAGCAAEREGEHNETNRLTERETEREDMKDKGGC